MNLEILTGLPPTHEPIKPVAGQMYYDIETGQLMQYSGSEWEILGEYEMIKGAVIDIEREQEARNKRVGS